MQIQEVFFHHENSLDCGVVFLVGHVQLPLSKLVLHLYSVDASEHIILDILIKIFKQKFIGLSNLAGLQIEAEAKTLAPRTLVPGRTRGEFSNFLERRVNKVILGTIEAWGCMPGWTTTFLTHI